MTDKTDIVLLGATGFTGRITAKYLSEHCGAFTWAIAGRNREKLSSLQKDLGPAGEKVAILVADFDKPETLDAICRRTRCIISCAGPFNECGMPVVAACVRNGVHYIDSTGEFTFVRRTIEEYDAKARQEKVVVVSCCGFDCVPSDLGNYVVHREAKEEVKEVRAYFTIKSAGISAGTANSIAQIAKYIKKEDMSPTSLNPSGEEYKRPIGAPTRLGLWYDRSIGSWTAPFIMAACNERIVRRTNALMGSQASYVECAPAGLLSCIGLFTAYYFAGSVIAFRPLQSLFMRAYPKDVAHGPAGKERSASFFTCTFSGITKSGKSVSTTMHADMDVYDATAVFLAECAFSALTLDKKGQLRSGVLTPAAAFGDELLARSRNAGVHIKTEVQGVKAEQIAH